MQWLFAQVVATLCFVAPAGSSGLHGTTLPQAVADRFGAKCLDGTAPMYDVRRNVSSKKWVLYLEGGGWCNGPEAAKTKRQCAERVKFQWPPSPTALAKFSSTHNQKTTEFTESDAIAELLRNPPKTKTKSKVSPAGSSDLGGVMSLDPDINPDFYSWNKVYFNYCDGASFGSSRAEPILVSTPDDELTLMWMRGRNNFDAVVYHLLTEVGMGDATEVILSGSSAGGLAVLYNLDHFATLLPPTVKRVFGLVDAGFFLDVERTWSKAERRAGKASSDDLWDFRNNFVGADPVWNVTGSRGTNENCLAAHSSEDAWKCLMAPYLVEHVETPMFVLNTIFDNYQLAKGLRASCIPKYNRFTPCTEEQNETLRSFRARFLEDIKKVTMKPQNGVYLSSCYAHSQAVDYCYGQTFPNCVGWSPLDIAAYRWNFSTSVALGDGTRMTPQEAVSAYYHGDAVVVIDEESFFDNPTCTYRGKAPIPLCTALPSLYR